MTQTVPLDPLEAAFTDDMADRLRPLVDRADQGDWWAGIKVRLLLAFTPRLWDRHAVLAMQAERAGLVASANRPRDRWRREQMGIVGPGVVLPGAGH